VDKPRIGGKRHLCARLKRAPEILALRPPNLFFLLDGLRQHAGLRAFLQNKIVVANVEIEISPVLLGKRNAFVVDQVRVPDGIDPCINRVLGEDKSLSKILEMRKTRLLEQRRTVFG
jgi:hypothetical protein